MSGHGEKMRRKQEQAIGALLSTRTIAEAAAQVGVAESTLRRWLKDESFLKEYQCARRQCMGVAIYGITRMCSLAVETLEEVMSDRQAPASSRIAAAKAVLEAAAKIREEEDIESRLETLEAALGSRGGAR